MKNLNNIKKLVENFEPHICDCCGKISYCAKEVCDLLGIDDVERALNGMDPDMKTEMISDSDEEDWDLSEPEKKDVVTLNGIFALVFKSQISFAKIIQRWIIDGFVEKILLDEDEPKELRLLPAEAVC
jgi:prophage antirepressor-like protein